MMKKNWKKICKETVILAIKLALVFVIFCAAIVFVVAWCAP